MHSEMTRKWQYSVSDKINFKLKARKKDKEGH